MLLDTSGLLALLDAREQFHSLALQAYPAGSRRVTHGFVLSELVALAGSRGVPSKRILQYVASLLANPDVQTVWPNEQLTSRAIALLLARQGRGYSLCDAVSFVIMRDANLQAALTTDKHFEEEGFERLLK